jgi:HD-like signal output (HDOD) protein
MSKTIEATEGRDGILKKLRDALNADGDFPVRARVVADIRKLANDPETPMDKIVELILGEPSLGMRLLHMVNSVLYNRRVEILTVSQAVVHLGMRALADVCAGLVLLQRFTPTAQRGGIFADNVKKSILTSVLTSAFVVADDDAEERGYLAGTFYSMGPLLLAFYFPQVFEAAEKRAVKRGQTITQSITETLGIAPVALSAGIVENLSIPEYYSEVIGAAVDIQSKVPESESEYSYSQLAQALADASKVADAIVDTHTRMELKTALESFVSKSTVSIDQLVKILSKVPAVFKQQCETIDMKFLTLPEHFVSFLASPDDLEHVSESAEEEALTGDQLNYYLEDIRQAILNQENMSSIITSVMEAIAFGLEFDRVMLMVSDSGETTLQGKMALGESFGIEPTRFTRAILDESHDAHPDSNAFVVRSVEMYGDPVFEDGWPFLAIPIGQNASPIGVIYADIVQGASKGLDGLNERTQLAANVLADLLDQALLING